MPSVEWRRPVFEARTVRIGNAGEERRLISVGITERFRERVVSGQTPFLRQPLLDAQMQRVIFRFAARFKVDHAVEGAGQLVENRAETASQQNVRTEVAQVARARD